MAEMSERRCTCKHLWCEHDEESGECESEGSVGTGCACESWTPCEHPPGQIIPNSLDNPYCKVCSTHWRSDEAYEAETGHAVPKLERYEAL